TAQNGLEEARRAPSTESALEVGQVPASRTPHISAISAILTRGWSRGVKIGVVRAVAGGGGCRAWGWGREPAGGVMVGGLPATPAHYGMRARVSAWALGS